SRAAERGAHPCAAGDELEGAGGNLLPCSGNPGDDRLAPAAMAGFERLAHDRDIAGAVERVVSAADLVGAALGHVDEVRDDIPLNLARIDEMGHAEALAPFLLGVVEIDPDDHVGA